MNERKLTLGYNTRGTEDYFESMLRRAINERSTPGFRYVEVGIAEGTTLASVAELVRDSLPNQQFQCVGIDLFDGPFFNERNFLKRTLAFNTLIEFAGRGRDTAIPAIFGYDLVVILLKGDSKRAIAQPKSINFALIDGCHGAPCVEKDFLAIEAGIAPGGIVAFHDAGAEDQGIHFQQHCQMPISVLNALNNLGLGPNACLTQLDSFTGISSDGCNRPGWKFIGSVEGDKSPGNLQSNGHGFKFFQKI
jgi:hypothetical protein